MTYKERLIELLQHSPTDAMGNHGVGAMADHLMDNGLVFKELYEDMEERIAHQRVRAQTAEHFICSLCSECDCKEDNGIATMTLKCCSMFPECGKFKLRSGWIPVSERLPEKEELVLIICKNGARFVGFYNCFHDGISWGIKTALNSTRWLNKGRVTHWMPLPEPPEEQK